MPLLANVLLTTSRPTFNAGTGATSVNTSVAHLSGVMCALAEIDADQALRFNVPNDALTRVEYHGYVDSGTDIVTGDRITAITLLDGVTAWPADMPTTNVVWQVTYARETAPDLLPERYVLLAREIGSGPLHN